MDDVAAVDGGRRRTRWVLGAGVLALVIVGVVIVLRVPGTKPPAGFASTSQAVPEGSAVVVYLRVDSFDAAKGTMAARVSAGPGPALPPGGARVRVGEEGRPELVIGRDAPSAEQSVVLDIDRGSVSSYPFDEYELDEPIAAVPADASSAPGAEGTTTLPLAIVGASTAAGFDVDAVAGVDDPRRVDVTISVDRVRPQEWWAIGMMAVDWALALAAVAVVAAIVLRERPWETRHLAWLGSMIFALAAFRNTAPGNPPIGVFLDFAAFFWAEALVVASLLALVVVYLFRTRADLDL